MVNASILSKHFTAWPDGAEGMVINRPGCPFCAILTLESPDTMMVLVARRLLTACQGLCVSCGAPAGAHAVAHPHPAGQGRCGGFRGGAEA